jgi:hypothetical protein
MIIDATNFRDRPYKVPNQEESRDFISFIEQAEEQIARGTVPGEKVCLLGSALWDEFQAGLATSGEIEARWVAIRDGANYTHNGKTYHYPGWVEMLTPGIFALWVPNIPYKLTNIGYVENDAPDKSTLLDDQYPFIVNAWNDFVSKVGGNRNYAYTCIDSFYGFMKANESDYDNWVFRCPHFKNRHDL